MSRHAIPGPPTRQSARPQIAPQARPSAGLPASQLQAEANSTAAAKQLRLLQTRANGSPPAKQLQRLQQKPAAAGPAATVIQRAGTKPNVASTDGRYRIKLSSGREKYTYEHNAALGLGGVLPGEHTVTAHQTNASGEVTQVTATVGGIATTINLASPIEAPSGNKQLLVIDTVGYEPPAALPVAPAQKLFIDVKIGTHTKSGTQFALEGANPFWARFKQIEHDLKDLTRKSRGEGYDVDAGNARDFDTEYQFALANPHHPRAVNLKAAMQQVMRDLATIKTTIIASPVRFVGASLFFVLNLTRPQNSAVKLIDPDHPIIDLAATDLPAAAPADVTTPGTTGMAKREWQTYFTKWQNSFDTGIKSFIEDWFAPRMDNL